MLEYFLLCFCLMLLVLKKVKEKITLIFIWVKRWMVANTSHPGTWSVGWTVSKNYCNIWNWLEFLYILSYCYRYLRGRSSDSITFLVILEKMLQYVFFSFFSNRVYPSHWPQNLKKVIKIPVNGSRYNELSSKFKTSMGTTNVQIINIQEICNPDFYDRYEAWVSSFT